jgi:hypothetical protein
MEKSGGSLPSPPKGAISLSGLSLHLKPEFIEYMCEEGAAGEYSYHSNSHLSYGYEDGLFFCVRIF